MAEFILTERYKLELHWSKVLRPKAGVMQFVDAYFSGPVLARADKLKENDSIMLDFCSQMIILTKDVYTAKFSWNNIEYKDKKIYLKSATLSFDPILNNIPSLSNKDYLVIDTQNHENEKHAFNLLYPTYVVGTDNALYNYRSN